MKYTNRPITFVEAVIMHPKMYTTGGSYGEVNAFLKGHMGGLIKGLASVPVAADGTGSPDPWEFREFKEWSEFRDQLATELETDSSHAFARFRERYGTDGEALTELLRKAQSFFDAAAGAQPEAE
jgi:hypothetical protein